MEGFRSGLISKAINSTTGQNFTAFINEYRIKEAVKILSDSNFDYLSTDSLLGEVGFANRFTFSNAFKKIVGITPSEFKRNREMTLKIKKEKIKNCVSSSKTK